jgi:hypothetical protein
VDPCDFIEVVKTAGVREREAQLGVELAPSEAWP